MVLGRQHIIIAGRDLADFGVYISGNGTYNAPARDVKSVAIPGRNGDLTLDNGRFKNVTVKYPAFIVEDFGRNIDALRDFLGTLRGYSRLEDTYHPDEYRMARVNGAFTAKPVDKLVAGKFDLSFDCMPQRWLKSGEVKLPTLVALGGGTKSTQVMNPTSQSAMPLLLCKPVDYMLININNVQMKLTQAATNTIIDCELQEAYSATTGANHNSYLQLNDGVFPTLDEGLNTISITATGSGVMYTSSMTVTPRWWCL